MKENILNQMVETKRREVAAAKAQLPEARLREAVGQGHRSRSFMKALRTPGPSGVNIIAEIKRASPSKGPLNPHLDPAAVARAYERGGATALSVLTDFPHFKGSLADLRDARTAVSLPVLRKDIIISTYQIYQSAAEGIDAILLITTVLEKQELIEFLNLSRELGIDALVEVHNEKELDVAMNANALLIGINNRDLRSFRTDIRTAPRLAAMIDKDRIAVAASGISSPEDIALNRCHGIFNFLIGESLVTAAHPEKHLRYLLHATID